MTIVKNISNRFEINKCLFFFFSKKCTSMRKNVLSKCAQYVVQHWKITAVSFCCTCAFCTLWRHNSKNVFESVLRTGTHFLSWKFDKYIWLQKRRWYCLVLKNVISNIKESTNYKQNVNLFIFFIAKSKL